MIIQGALDTLLQRTLGAGLALGVDHCCSGAPYDPVHQREFLDAIADDEIEIAGQRHHERAIGIGLMLGTDDHWLAARRIPTHFDRDAGDPAQHEADGEAVGDDRRHQA